MNGHLYFVRDIGDSGDRILDGPRGRMNRLIFHVFFTNISYEIVVNIFVSKTNAVTNLSYYFKFTNY